MLFCCAIGVGLFAPLWPNLDSSFQGFNMWHSIQYLALTWFITRSMTARGEHTNGFMRWLGGERQTGARWYGFGLGMFVFVVSIGGVCRVAFVPYLLWLRWFFVCRFVRDFAFVCVCVCCVKLVRCFRRFLFRFLRFMLCFLVSFFFC